MAAPVYTHFEVDHLQRAMDERLNQVHLSHTFSMKELLNQYQQSHIFSIAPEYQSLLFDRTSQSPPPPPSPLRFSPITLQTSDSPLGGAIQHECVPSWITTLVKILIIVGAILGVIVSFACLPFLAATITSGIILLCATLCYKYVSTGSRLSLHLNNSTHQA